MYTYIHTYIHTRGVIRPGYDTLLQVCLTLHFKISLHRSYCINIANSPYAVTKLKPIICPYWHSNAIMMPEFPSIYLLHYDLYYRSHWPRGLMSRSAAIRLLKGVLPHWGLLRQKQNKRQRLTETTGGICKDRFLVVTFSVWFGVRPFSYPQGTRSEAITTVWSWPQLHR
jgi:hypothetical protein